MLGKLKGGGAPLNMCEEMDCFARLDQLRTAAVRLFSAI